MDMAFHSAFAPLDRPLQGESGEVVLRPLEWADLCAKLVARRDLRAARAAGAGSATPAASFHGSAARWLATRRDGDAPVAVAEAVDENVVNPNPSATGKAEWGKSLPEAGAAIAGTTHQSVEFE